MSEIQKFLFDGLPVRGAIVRVDHAWQEVLRRRAANTETGPYPPDVTRLLGEMAAAGLLLQSNINFEGALVLQIQGDGPLRLAVAEVQSNLEFRVTANLDPSQREALAEGCDLATLVNQHGQGRCAITLDADDKRPGYRPYQGIVSLCDEQGETLPDLAAILQQYMRQSEQLDTVIVLAADAQVAAGLLIQRIPVKGEANLAGRQLDTEATDALGQNEDFNRIATLAASLRQDELLGLDSEAILHRLFWQEPLMRIGTNAAAPAFACRCNRERVATMLRTLGAEEVEGIVAERGLVEIGCDFCGQQYRFDAVDVGRLFSPLASPPGSEHLQ
ncbi:Hsp33 family molecular chaperone HslO [Corticibacter populi]|uniref:Hsp33 family molecular chaperone HslO n=1 Tax=Corticibacter populi TaxID=1550736 RepID=A0A3M6QHS5_9BURK|nr:Hsp33 family molecular chaperone HslO [Corticibacter populi]RMX02598.1 Hsp33 family molecular chaperone HslO [Corticibacter populi]RZS32989.1 molecular chaperone Hsp33 [Corticibacter populi]